MDNEKFAAILSLITAALVDKISKKYFLKEDVAIGRLYRTEFYKYLEDEKTKVWQFSVEKMFVIFQTEIKTGKLDFPDY